MMSPHEYQRLLARLKTAAQQEKDALFKTMPKDFAERVADVSIRFEGEPSKDMQARGVSVEAFSMVQEGADGRELVVFLMNLLQRYGKELGAFRREFRRTLLKELADMAGVEMELGD